MPKREDKIYSYLDFLYTLDYQERPVSMDQFLSDPEFFGNMTECGKTIYDYWLNTLRELSKEDSKYIVVLTGGIGSGKTRTAIYAIGYTMYRILCLKDPWKFFKKSGGGKFDVVFFNLTKSLGDSRGFHLLQSHLCSSNWFRRHGRISGKGDDEKIHLSLFDFKLASPQALGFGFIGGDILIAIMDEVDNPIASEKQRIKILAAYDAAMRRFKGRFVFDGESMGRFFLVASKQEKLSFLNTYIIEMKNNPNVYIKDAPIWEILPKSIYSGQRFNISLGDIYTPPKIIESSEEIEQVKANGFKTISVPIEYKEEFSKRIIDCLRDFAGISVTHLRSHKLFASENILMECYDKSRPKAVRKSTIEVGLKDDIDFCNFIDFSSIQVPRNVPRFIHVDIAFTGDALGLGMSCIKGWKRTSSVQKDGTIRVNKKPCVETDVGMRFKAKHGDQIPINKIQKLIIDLKEIHRFNIILCTFDLRIASISSMQILELAGIKCGDLSLDKDPQIYRGFRDLVSDGRWSCYFDPFLHFELSNLDDDPDKNKIDHPDKVPNIIFLKDGSTEEIVLDGSKDISDGVAGSAMKALECCQEPPDIEIMKDLMGIATAPTIMSQQDEGNELLALGTKPTKNADKSESRIVSTYRDILKKAKQ